MAAPARPEAPDPALAVPLDAAACAAVDSTNQIGEALDLGVHLRDALWRVDSAAVPPIDAPGGLIVAGMGGSSVGGRLAAGALAPRLRRPLALAMGYDVPAWIGRETLVLCSSYSGATEETLATYDAAKAAGAPE
jgi:glucose/mannose-6-phosphate isomerase